MGQDSVVVVANHLSSLQTFGPLALAALPVQILLRVDVVSILLLFYYTTETVFGVAHRMSRGLGQGRLSCYARISINSLRRQYTRAS